MVNNIGDYPLPPAIAAEIEYYEENPHMLHVGNLGALVLKAWKDGFIDGLKAQNDGIYTNIIDISDES